MPTYYKKLYVSDCFPTHQLNLVTDELIIHLAFSEHQQIPGVQQIQIAAIDQLLYTLH